MKKIIKKLKQALIYLLIFSFCFPCFASLEGDSAAFITKEEFDLALADFNNRLTKFEAGINSKIDSQVTSYLSRNGIWSAVKQDVYKEDGTVVKSGDAIVQYNWHMAEAFGMQQVDDSQLPTVNYGETDANTITSKATWESLYRTAVDAQTVQVNLVKTRWMARTSGLGHEGYVGYFGFMTPYEKSKSLYDAKNNIIYKPKKMFVANKTGLAWIEWSANKGRALYLWGLGFRGGGDDFNLDHAEVIDIGFGFSCGSDLKARVSCYNSATNWMDWYQKVGESGTGYYTSGNADGSACFPLQFKSLNEVTVFFVEKGDQIDICQYPIYSGAMKQLDIMVWSPNYTKNSTNNYKPYANITKCVVY